jgi:hypothetical protein
MPANRRKIGLDFGLAAKIYLQASRMASQILFQEILEQIEHQ